jgi:hypothetical protein
MIAVGVAIISFCKADTITSAMVQQDPRLEKPVTLSARSISLKAILDQFASQTGISLAMPERDPSSGYLIQIECNQIPVGKMMNALYGLLSIHNGEWAWIREGKSDTYTYTLRETPGAKNRTDTYNHLVNDLLSNYITVLRHFTSMPMEERKLRRNQLKQALHLDNEEMLASLFDQDFSKVFWAQAQFFFSALTSQQQQTVMQGGSVSVSLQSLPTAAYDLFHQDYLFRNEHIQSSDGTLVPVPEPETIGFHRVDPSSALDQLAPRIDISEPRWSVSWMGTGHLELGIRDALKQAWMLPGDLATDPANQIVVKEPSESDALRKEKAKVKAANEAVNQRLPEGFARRPVEPFGINFNFTLQRLAQGSSIPLLAILPTKNQRQYPDPVGKPVQSFLDQLEKGRKSFFYKWRDGVLLINNPYWFSEPFAVIPYSLLRQLHADKQGHVPLTELAEFVGKISEDQAQWFAAKNEIGNFRLLYPCLLFLAEYPRALQEGGVSIGDTMLHRLQAVSVVPGSLPSEPQVQLRIREEAAPDTLGKASLLDIENYDAERRQWKLLSKVTLPPLQDLAAQK